MAIQSKQRDDLITLARFLATSGTALDRAMSDGKIHIDDLLHVVPVLKRANSLRSIDYPALLSSLPLLDNSDQDAIVDAIKTDLQLTDGFVEEQVEQLITVLASVAQMLIQVTDFFGPLWRRKK